MDSTISISTTEKTSNENATNNFIYVPRNIIHKRKLTLNFAIKSISTDENVTPDQKLIQLQELKECCRDSFKTQIEALMINEVQNQRIQYTEVIGNKERKCFARTIQQLKTAIKQNHSLAFMEKLYHVMYGCFDLKPGWAKTLEASYMESKKIRYTKESRNQHPERDKGCFELMARDAKSELVHTLQRVGKASSHGYYINLQMPKTNKGKRSQRILGEFYGEMVKNVNGVTFDFKDLCSNEDGLSNQNGQDCDLAEVVSLLSHIYIQFSIKYLLIYCYIN